MQNSGGQFIKKNFSKNLFIYKAQKLLKSKYYIITIYKNIINKSKKERKNIKIMRTINIYHQDKKCKKLLIYLKK